MRSNVAGFYGGHPFEDKYLEMDELQLVVLNEQVKREHKHEFDKIKMISEAWSKKMSNLFETLFLFTDPKMFSEFKEQEKVKEHESEVPIEDFPEYWEELMNSIPTEMIAVEEEADTSSVVPEAGDEFKSLDDITTFLNKKRNRGAGDGDG